MTPPSHEFVSCNMRSTQHRKNESGNLKPASAGSHEPNSHQGLIVPSKGKGIRVPALHGAPQW